MPVRITRNLYDMLLLIWQAKLCFFAEGTDCAKIKARFSAYSCPSWMLSKYPYQQDSEMIRLPNSRDAWKTSRFNETLKRELEALDSASLPLQQNLTLSSCVSDEPFKVMVIQSQEASRFILVKIAIMYSGIEAGCNCADDPTPIDTHAEYCELMVSIDKNSTVATIGGV